MPYANAKDGTDLFYKDWGTGKPVVLMHGWPLTGDTFDGLGIALADKGYRAIIIDRRGFGRSDQPWTGNDYDTYADDVAAILDDAKISDPVALVGFSMGGGEVARYLGAYGTDRVAKAVFASAVPPYLFKADDNPDGALNDAAIAGFEAGVKGDRLAFLDEFTSGFFSANGTMKVSEPQREYARDLAAFASPKGTLDCIAAFGRTDFRGDLDKVTVPTLVIHGDSDAIVPFEASGKRTAATIAGSELVVIKDGPHGINASHSKEFNQALLDFLAR